MAKQKKVLITTPRGIAAFAYIHKPDTGKQYSDNKYKVDLVLDGDTDMVQIEKTIRDFAAEVFPKADLSDLQLPFKSGDGAKQEEFHGKIILKTKSKYAPKVVDGKRRPLKKGVEARSGDEIRCVVSLYAYEQVETVKENGKKVQVTVYGVSLQLQVVQIVTKNAGGGGIGMLDDIEDGYDSSEDDDFGGRDEDDDAPSGADDDDF